jgi:hypothetical protein
MRAYILMERGFEYDDNYYNPTEGGNPKKIYFSKKDAEIDKKIFDLERFTSEGPLNYIYDTDDAIKDSDKMTELTNRLLEKYGAPVFKSSWQRLEEYQLHPNANEEEKEEYIKLMRFSFYEIKEVDVDQSSFRNYQIDSVLK